jgi:hypothetical protein
MLPMCPDIYVTYVPVTQTGRVGDLKRVFNHQNNNLTH